MDRWRMESRGQGLEAERTERVRGWGGGGVGDAHTQFLEIDERDEGGRDAAREVVATDVTAGREEEMGRGGGRRGGGGRGGGGKTLPTQQQLMRGEAKD